MGTQECYLHASGANILPPVTSGKVTTRNRFNFKYGRIDVRAKLPAGNWLIPGKRRSVSIHLLKAWGANILPTVTSGKVPTRNCLNFKYGGIDVRAKLPASNWLIPGKQRRIVNTL